MQTETWIKLFLFITDSRPGIVASEDFVSIFAIFSRTSGRFGMGASLLIFLILSIVFAASLKSPWPSCQRGLSGRTGKKSKRMMLIRVVAMPRVYQSPRYLARKGRTARPMTHHTHPDMKANFLPLSSQISAQIVYPALTPTGKNPVPRAV